MIKHLAVLLLLLICVGAVYAEETDIIEDIESSARTWLVLTDSGRYAESWKKTSPLLQKEVSESEWVKTIGAIRKPLGSMGVRYLATAGTTDELSGFPDGEYVVVQFYTKFQHQELALETITLSKQSDKIWHVVEYAIQ